jgi:hypothetical protein
MMKKTILALILSAAAATPALAGGFRQAGAITPSPAFAYNETAKAKPYRAPTSIATYSHVRHVAGNARHNMMPRHSHG